MKHQGSNQETGIRRTTVNSTAFVIFTAIAAYLCFVIAKPFISPLVWAMAFAILGFPLYQKTLGLIRSKNLAAGIVSLFIALVVIVPVAVLARQVVNEVTNNFEYVRAMVMSGDWRLPFQKHHLTSDFLSWLESEFKVNDLISKATGTIPSIVSNIVSGSMNVIFEAVVGFVATFFFFRDSDSVVAGVRSFIPLTKVETNRILERVKDTMYATVFGEILISVITGILGGLAFWALGFQAPVLWGFAMGLLAFLPILGTWIVWLPAALFLFVEDRWAAGVLLIVWGLVVMTALTTFLYPKLVGNRLRLHTFLVFIALIGGLAAFGFIGIILGPLVLALTIELLAIWRRRLGVREIDPDSASG